MATRKKGPVFRVTGLPASQPDQELAVSLEAAVIGNMAEDEQSKLALTVTVVPSCYDNTEKVALVEFHGGVPAFLSELVANPLSDWQVEMGDTDINFDQHFFGFTQLYPPEPGSPATADIIAITGLDGHAYGSWRGKGNLGRMWLRDFLCKDLPRCRMMIYGYNAKLLIHGVDTILDYGRRLMEELKKVRNTEELRKRPLFFVAHSFGGIILAHCLVKAVQADEDDHPTIASLHRATYGMLLFGIPHKGLVIDDIQKIVAGESNHPREGLLQEVKSKSHLLAYQLVDFKNLIRDRKVVSFYETGQTRQLQFDRESRCWRRTGDFITVVDADSALLQLPDSMEDKIPLDADHSMIVKFDNRSNYGYTSARDKLRQFEQDAPEVVAARFSRRNITQFALSLNLAATAEAHHFIAREEELAWMRQRLNRPIGRCTVVVHGLGGMGKTQLAIAYAKHHRNDYSASIWLNARDETSLNQSFRDAAVRILQQHPGLSYIQSVVSDKDSDASIAVKRWLDEPGNSRWLLIYDNYDHPKMGDEAQEVPAGDSDSSARPGELDQQSPKGYDIRPYLPGTDHGAVIITTRSSTVHIGESLRLQKLQKIEDSLRILESTSGRKGTPDNDSAYALARKLDGLPLALSTAGVYMREVSTSWQKYLEDYDSAWRKLQELSPRLPTYENRAMYSTWNISYASIRRQSEPAAMLVRLWAFFGNEDLWYELLRRGATENGYRWLIDLTKTRLDFDHHMRVLCNHGLVEAHSTTGQSGAESSGYSVHACVHSWMLHMLNSSNEQDLSVLAMECVSRHVPKEVVPMYWLIQRRLLVHADRCQQLIDDVSNDASRAWIPASLGILYADQGRLKEAEAMYERALQGYEKAWGQVHISTLNTVNNLANLYKSQGRLNKAEEMYERALQGKEKAWGPEHTSTLDTVNNIAILYAEQGRLKESETMYRRALQGYEKAWGPEHMSTLDTVNNIAILYVHQGRLQEAEIMFKRALQGREKAWGPEHTSTLDIVNNLAGLYVHQGRLQEAEIMFKRALQGREKAWGPVHPLTLTTINNIGFLYADQGRLQEAEIMFKRALQGREKALGPENTSTLDTVNNLAGLYRSQGRLKESEAMCERALQGYEKALGQDGIVAHVPFLKAAIDRGLLYADLGQTAKAKKMYIIVLPGIRKVFGDGSDQHKELEHLIAKLSD